MRANILSLIILSVGISAKNLLGTTLLRKAVNKVDNVIEGVNLPTDIKNIPIGEFFKNFFRFSFIANFGILKDRTPVLNVMHKYIIELPKTNDEKDLSKTIPVQPKRSAFFRELFVRATNEFIKDHFNDVDPSEGYLYFGNRDFKTILPMLCQVNPFFASALTLSKNKKFFELKSFTTEPESIQEPLYLSLMREMTDDAHRINAKFDKKMRLVEVTKLDTDLGNAVVVPEEEWDYYSSGIIYNMLFYSSTIHATMHVLHYLMCTCITMVTRKSSASMRKWADIYGDNIAIKFVEVGGLLFRSLVPAIPPIFLSDEAKLVSGVDGFGATPEMMPKVKKLIQLWGSLKNEEDFNKKFLLNGIYSTAGDETTAEYMMREGEILCEYKKHSNNVQPFAEELAAAFKEDDPTSFEMTEKKIKSFMEACGADVSSIDSISSWTQLMCLTGIVHGSTLSYSRMIIVPEIVRWRNIHSKVWDNHDASLMDNGFATSVGMTKDRHTFTSRIGGLQKWNTKKIVDPVMEVLQKYDGIASGLKTEYTKEIEQRDDFHEYGWILTDHCNDGYDGKQHTITTYI
jgi:hypothetical protein